MMSTKGRSVQLVMWWCRIWDEMILYSWWMLYLWCCPGWDNVLIVTMSLLWQCPYCDNFLLVTMSYLWQCPTCDNVLLVMDVLLVTMSYMWWIFTSDVVLVVIMRTLCPTCDDDFLVMWWCPTCDMMMCYLCIVFFLWCNDTSDFLVIISLFMHYILPLWYFACFVDLNLLIST